MTVGQTQPDQGVAPGEGDFDSILASIRGQSVGGGNQILGEPWGVSFVFDAPIYYKLNTAKPSTMVERHGGTSLAAATDAQRPPAAAPGEPQYGTKQDAGLANEAPGTGSEYLQQMAHWSPHDVSEWQARLAKLGLLEPETYNVGDGTDGRTLQAMAGVLRVATLKQVSPDDAMSYLEKVTPNMKVQEAKAEGEARSKAAYNAYLSEMQSTYLRTWGVPAPQGYIDRAAKAGMNIYEFEAHERAKPAFQNSEQGQYERVGLESQIAQWMGRG